MPILDPKLVKNTPGVLSAVFRKSLFYLSKTLLFEFRPAPGPPKKQIKIIVSIQHLFSTILGSKMAPKLTPKSMQIRSRTLTLFLSILDTKIEPERHSKSAQNHEKSVPR